VQALLDDPDVGEYHAVVNHEIRSGVATFTLYALRDRKVAVNGRPVGTAACLRSGDLIRAGNTELVFFQVYLEPEKS
jgi:hypothetical protein